MKVKKRTLALIACIVWSIAGVNILRIGILEYPPYLGLINGLLSFAVFFVFQKAIFGKLVKKHSIRMKGYEEEKHFFMKFFDVKSFVIMAVMMSGGIYLRSSAWVPREFIAVFYTGLGAALFLAGVGFGTVYLKWEE